MKTLLLIASLVAAPFAAFGEEDLFAQADKMLPKDERIPLVYVADKDGNTRLLDASKMTSEIQELQAALKAGKGIPAKLENKLVQVVDDGKKVAELTGGPAPKDAVKLADKVSPLRDKDTPVPACYRSRHGRYVSVRYVDYDFDWYVYTPRTICTSYYTPRRYYDFDDSYYYTTRYYTPRYYTSFSYSYSYSYSYTYTVSYRTVSSGRCYSFYF